MHGSADLFRPGDEIIVDGRHHYTVIDAWLELHPNGPQLMLRVWHHANGTKYDHRINAKRAEPINPRLPL